MDNTGLVSFGLDLVAALSVAIVLVVVLLHNRREKIRENRVTSLYEALLICLMVLGIVDGIVRLIDSNVLGQHTLPFIVSIMPQILSSVFCLLWLMYVDYRLYHSRDYITRRLLVYSSPVILLTVMAVCTTVAYLVNESEETGIAAVLIILLLVFIRFLYIIISIIRLSQYKKQSADMRFFKISYFLIPVIVAAILDISLPYSFSVVGYAIGISLLYFPVALERRYMDDETGFYNERYIELISRLVQKGKYPMGSVMYFDSDGAPNISELSYILRDQVPKSCECVRYKPNGIMVISGITDPSPLHMVTEDVCISVEERNRDTDKGKINIKTSYKVRKMDESVREFMDRTILAREDQS